MYEENFTDEDSKKIMLIFLQTNYYNIAISQSKIDKLKGKSDNLVNVYRFLKIYKNKLVECKDIAERFIIEINKVNKRVDWEKDKKMILEGYLGIYNCELEDYLKANERQEDV